jgi:hypothetical protein
MQPALAKPLLVEAIVCVTAAIAIPAVRQLWVAYLSSAWLITFAALLGMALVLFLVSTAAIAVRSK